jgi:hypothetical protein
MATVAPDKEILQERAQLVRLYEANCSIPHPTDKDMLFRSALMNKLDGLYNLRSAQPKGAK